jgi:hypothetical protein
MKPQWTKSDQKKALSEGWGVFYNSEHGPRIERYDVAKRFHSDAQAQAYVAMRAMAGDKLSRHAWAYLAHAHDLYRRCLVNAPAVTG